MTQADCWADTPMYMRSTIASYVNSENERDRAYALELCARYDLSYAETRAAILREIIEQSRELGKAWTPAVGSRPLSEERP
jgi:hypothetical protein